ncbi:MAG: hypothetical protein HUJ26_12695 [Planctomycetaceae bacterium]|nr:hypothetical protein [Planctomycetaceae bacterium]
MSCTHQQATLFDVEETFPERFAQWLAFHRDNPQVWAWFKFYAGELQKHQQIGSARLIGERIRWETAVRVTREADLPKLNDHHWPYYARLLMATDERFAGFFHTRDAKFDVDIETLVRLANEE